MAKIQPKKTIPTTTTTSALEQEELLQELRKKDKKKSVQRVTIDFPQFIYDQMKDEIENNGQTLKGFLVGLVREHFIRKEGQ